MRSARSFHPRRPPGPHRFWTRTSSAVYPGVFRTRTQVMYSWSRRLGLVIAAVLTFSSCQAFAQSAAPAKASLRLDWKGGGQHAPFYLAKERGYYKDEGIDLDIISGSGSSDVVKQVGSKAVEFGVADALVLVQAAEQRVPLTAVAAYYQRTPIVVLSPRSKPVTDPQQLT